MVEVDEDPEISTDEFLDWYCWSVASTAERFYPPDETAEECCEARDITDQFERGMEYGQHCRELTMATMFFSDMENHGFDPKARAQRSIERSREEGLDIPDIDWTWWEDP